MRIKVSKARRGKCIFAWALATGLAGTVLILKAKKAAYEERQESFEDRDPASQRGEAFVVYVTDQGDKYHSFSCPHLQKSRRAIEKSEARRQGYQACGVCKP